MGGPLTDRRAIPTMQRGGAPGAAMVRPRSGDSSFPGAVWRMPAFTHHVFVCGNVREPGHRRGCCDPEGKQALRDAFKKEMKKAGFGPLARPTMPAASNNASTGRRCDLPAGIWYGRVRARTSPGSWPGRSWRARSSTTS